MPQHQRFLATVTPSDYMIFTKGIYNVNYDIYIWFPNFSIYFGLTKLKGVCSANIHRTNSRRTANCSPSNCRPAKEWYGAVAAITTWWWGGELGQKWVLQPWDFNPNWDLYIYVICLDIYIICIYIYIVYIYMFYYDYIYIRPDISLARI